MIGKHKNIINLLGACTQDGELSLFPFKSESKSALCPSGSLVSLLCLGKTINNSKNILNIYIEKRQLVNLSANNIHNVTGTKSNLSETVEDDKRSVVCIMDR